MPTWDLSPEPLPETQVVGAVSRVFDARIGCRVQGIQFRFYTSPVTDHLFVKLQVKHLKPHLSTETGGECRLTGVRSASSTLPAFDFTA